MDKSERDLKKDLREALFRNDEYETQLDSVSKQIQLKDKQINEQNKQIQELRNRLYKSVDFTEFETLKENFDKICINLKESQNTNDLLNKRLITESEEIELLHNQNDSQINEINKLKKSLNEFKNIVEKQKAFITELDELKESRDYYKKELDIVLTQKSELHELVDICREEHLKHNESNISVEDLNHSISKFWDSFNGNTNGESMDCVIDMKLSDVERVLREKEILIKDLQNRVNLMSEEMICLKEWQLINVTENVLFEQLFKFFEQRFFSYIPLNRYFVTIGKRFMFSLTPKFLLRLYSSHK